MSGIDQSAAAPANNRPWLTAACDRALRRIVPGGRSRNAGPLSQVPRRLLVVKVHGLGDGVMVRSILEQLKSRHPQTHLGVMVGKGTAEIMTLDSSFSVHMYSQAELNLRSALAALIEIRRSHYDAVLNFEQGSVAGTAFLAAAGIPVRVGFIAQGQGVKARFLTHPMQFDENRSMWQSFVALARLLDPGLTETVRALRIRCRPHTESWLEEWWHAHVGCNDKVVAIHLGAGQWMNFKRWPLKRFVALAEELRRRLGSLSVILTGTETEKDPICRFMREYSGHAVDTSEFGALERTIGVLARCGLLISNDTGIMHLGAALGVPTVGLFGPASPQQWAPVGPRATYVYDTVAPCSPCINNYLNREPLVCVNAEKSRCMHDVSVGSVISAAARVVRDGWMG